MKNFPVFAMAFCWASLASAQVSFPEDVEDTLNAMLKTLRSEPLIRSLRIDYDDQSISFKIKDSDYELTAYPDNLHPQLQSASSNEEREDILNEFVQKVVSSFSGQDEAPINKNNILPVIRNAEPYTTPENDTRVSTTFVGDLAIYYVEDKEGSVLYLEQYHLEDLAMSQVGLNDLAMQNLIDRNWEPEIEGTDPYQLIFDGNFEASFLLDVPLWQRIDDQIGDILLAVPSRDTVLFIDGVDASSIDPFRRLAEGLFANESYPVSDQLFSWTGKGWALAE